MDHFSQRVSERYNINLNRFHKRRINSSIQGKNKVYKVIFWRKITNRITLWLVNINSKWIPVYYDKSRNTVTTCIEKSFDQIKDIVNNYERMVR